MADKQYIYAVDKSNDPADSCPMYTVIISSIRDLGGYFAMQITRPLSGPILQLETCVRFDTEVKKSLSNNDVLQEPTSLHMSFQHRI